MRVERVRALKQHFFSVMNRYPDKGELRRLKKNYYAPIERNYNYALTPRRRPGR